MASRLSSHSRRKNALAQEKNQPGLPPTPDFQVSTQGAAGPSAQNQPQPNGSQSPTIMEGGSSED